MAVQFRPARQGDLAAILALLADDALGRGREAEGGMITPEHVAAFAAIMGDANQLLAVVELGGEVVGCLQITFIPGLSRRGAWRGQFESVRIASHLRGQGLGEQFLLWAIAQCRARGCRLVQLTTDRQRDKALRFYQRLGFVASHHGMKLGL